ncbi:hypothetical protein B0H14DRAFT_2633323 [Mycena olivaceomarginata]|nr:hypothetical protein B0H14DRAFT_2633323 [Mycena olivaceomarginata]
MSEEGSPAPMTPHKKRYGRMSTGSQKPPPSPNPYLDLEAVESGDSGEEENLDKYETDFIDDGDPDHDDGSVFILFYSFSYNTLWPPDSVRMSGNRRRRHDGINDIKLFIESNAKET